MGKAATGPAAFAIWPVISTIRCGPTVQFEPVSDSAPGGDLTRRPPGQTFGERLSVFDEGLVREHRCAQSFDRLVGEPQLDEVGEGLQQDRISPALDERLGLLQKDGPRLVRTDRADGGEGTPQRTDGPEHERPVSGSCGVLCRSQGQAGAPCVHFAHPVFQVVGFELEAVGGERVGLYDVCAGPQVFLVDLRDHLGVGEVGAGVGVAEADAAFSQQRADGSVPDQDPPGEQLFQVRAQDKTSLVSSHIARRREVASAD